MTRILKNTSLKTMIAASAGLVALAFLASVAAAHGTGGQGGGIGNRPSTAQPAPGMGQGGMMGGAMGQGMTGQQQIMPCASQGQPAAGPCNGQGTGQMPGQTPGKMPGQTPGGQTPMMQQQIPPLRQ